MLSCYPLSPIFMVTKINVKFQISKGNINAILKVPHVIQFAVIACYITLFHGFSSYFFYLMFISFGKDDGFHP